MKPEPVFHIPANAACRNPKYWYEPNSLCRSCRYQYMQEPYCDTVHKIADVGIIECDGYERERTIDPSSPLPSYTSKGGEPPK